MVIKSNIKEDLVIGVYSGFKLSKKDVESVANALNKVEDLDYLFKLGKDNYTVLPILAYYTAYADKKKVATGSIFRYVSNLLNKEHDISKVDFSNMYKVMNIFAKVHTSIGYDLLGNGSRMSSDLYICARWLYDIGVLSDRRDLPVNKDKYDGKLKLMSVDEVFKNMASLFFDLRYSSTKKTLMHSVVNLVFNLETMLLYGNYDKDARLCEFIYLALRYYIEGKIGKVNAFSIDLDVDFESYGESIKGYLDGLNTLSLPLLTTPYGKLVESEIYLGSLAVMDNVHERLDFELIQRCKDIIDAINLEKDATVKEYRFKEKSITKELQCMKSELKSKDKELKYANKKIAKLEDGNGTVKLKDKIQELEETVKRLEGKLEQRDNRIVSLESKLEEKDATVSKKEIIEVTLNANKEEAISLVDLTFDEKVELLKDKRYVLIGGNSTLEQSLEQILPNITFKKDSLNFVLSDKVDYVLLYTKNIGHSNTFKVETFKHSLKGLIPLYNSNLEKIVDSIYDFIYM